MQSFDVVIAGGGVIGSSTAYFLTKNPDFKGRVLVVEKDPTYAKASTSLSAGGIRQQFSTPENVQISLFGAQFLKNIKEHLTVDGEVPDVSFNEGGYLFLATDKGKPILEQNHKIQIENGADIALLTPGQIKQRFPWMNVDDLAAGALGLHNEGWLDPYSLLQAFRKKAISQGATYIRDEVVNVKRTGNKIESVTLASGEGITCGHFINAAGARGHTICEMAGIENFPVHPRKRFVYVFDCREPIENSPLVVDITGAYFRPEGHSFICGISPEEEDDPDCLDFEMDFRLFEEIIWPAIAHRVPAFEAIKVGHSWAGHYDYNVIDQNAILGPHPEVRNFIFANGFSGHGLQQSPAVGRALSEQIIYGAYRTINLDGFGFDRFAKGKKIEELNVV